MKQGTPGPDSIDLSHFGHLQYPAGSSLLPEIDGDEIVVLWGLSKWAPVVPTAAADVSEWSDAR